MSRLFKSLCSTATSGPARQTKTPPLSLQPFLASHHAFSLWWLRKQGSHHKNMGQNVFKWSISQNPKPARKSDHNEQRGWWTLKVQAPNYCNCYFRSPQGDSQATEASGNNSVLFKGGKLSHREVKRAHVRADQRCLGSQNLAWVFPGLGSSNHKESQTVTRPFVHGQAKVLWKHQILSQVSSISGYCFYFSFYLHCPRLY